MCRVVILCVRRRVFCRVRLRRDNLRGNFRTVKGEKSHNSTENKKRIKEMEDRELKSRKELDVVMQVPSEPFFCCATASCHPPF